MGGPNLSCFLYPSHQLWNLACYFFSGPDTGDSISSNGNQRSEGGETQTIPHGSDQRRRSGLPRQSGRGNACGGLAPLATRFLCFSHDVTDARPSGTSFHFLQCCVADNSFTWNNRFVWAKVCMNSLNPSHFHTLTARKILRSSALNSLGAKLGHRLNAFPNESYIVCPEKSLASDKGYVLILTNFA